MKLADFQRDFVQALWSPREAVPAPTPLTALTVQPGFDVYRNTVLAGCVDALQANFPAVARLVGDAWFRAAAAVYTRERPPGEPMLMLYGRGFDAFLARFEPAAELPYLAAVARIDRLWSEAHAAADAAPLEAAALQVLIPADLARHALRLHPATRWSWCDEWPVWTLWDRNRQLPAGDDAPIAWRAEGVLLTRPHGAVLQRPLTPAGAALLAACAAGLSIEQAVAAALAADPAADVGELLGQCLIAGAFSAADPLPAHGRAVKGAEA